MSSEYIYTIEELETLDEFASVMDQDMKVFTRYYPLTEPQPETGVVVEVEWQPHGMSTTYPSSSIKLPVKRVHTWADTRKFDPDHG